MTHFTLETMLAGASVSCAAGYLGSLMISRQMALVGDALGHVALPGMGIAILLHIDSSVGALAFLSIGILSIWRLREKTALSIETLVGITFVTSLALGFLLIPQPDLLEGLIGDISKLTLTSALISVSASIGVIFLVRKIYSGMMLLSISEDLAFVEGISRKYHHLLFLSALALIVSVGVKITGSLLVGALLIIPPAAARVLAQDLKTYTRCSIAFGVASCLIGLIASESIHSQAGPTIIMVSTVIFLFSLIFKHFACAAEDPDPGIHFALIQRSSMKKRKQSEMTHSFGHFTRGFDSLDTSDIKLVGGKNASLGELIRKLRPKGIQVPDGFATTSGAYWHFVDSNKLRHPITEQLASYANGQSSLAEVGKKIRDLIFNARIPDDLSDEIRAAYDELGRRYNPAGCDVAVRSSATAEDLPEASFAGQQESFLNISGPEMLLEACRKCYASLFTDRAITYREQHGFDHMKVALSIGIQKMVRSDLAGAGVSFTLDPESGFPRIVLINAAWGLGEAVVKGEVTPDQYMTFKPLLGDSKFAPIIDKSRGEKRKKIVYSPEGPLPTKTVDTPIVERQSFVLSDDEILRLSRWSVEIESHYGTPMDIEWAKDGRTGQIYIVQARPETVHSRRPKSLIKSYKLKEKVEPILRGMSVGSSIATGKALVIKNVSDLGRFKENSILVTQMTDPDWGPVLKKAAAIITDTGGRTCHAAIVSRELGIPAVVGTGSGTTTLVDGQELTVSCAEGEQGFVYDRAISFEEREISLDSLPKTKTRIMMNAANPATAFRWWQLPVQGIGLARMEFIISNLIKIHPMALAQYESLQDPGVREEILKLTSGHKNKTDYFVETLSRGIAKLAASQFPNPVVVRMSDFKTNEYANLIGGKQFETDEANPMLGFRGASRYYSKHYQAGFSLECDSIKMVREEMGFTNVVAMIPFCRTLHEADRVLEVMAGRGLHRGVNELKIYVMAEIPSNILLAEEFSERFDGFSIGSNDLTQLVLGVDRDSTELAPLFDERNDAVKTLIRQLIQSAHQKGRPVGICGEAPSNYPDFAAFLVESGIDSISLNPDSILKTIPVVAQAESAGRRQPKAA